MIDQFFSRDTIPATPWKNGGGVTREILRSPEGMPYRRFSIADVDREGPFSKFEGLQRILTVIKGQGMVLSGNDGKKDALRLNPVRFSGNEDIFGNLPFGPIQDFNIIYDGTLVDAHALTGAIEDFSLEERGSGPLNVIYCISGELRAHDDRPLRPHEGIINPKSIPKAATSGSTVLWIQSWLKQKAS
jgi:environmental stress-induced protein Ves|tara:strand:+ start:2011 stop:2574 length:564 start_codon:yes stop_codon:yes gene_type:complete